MEYALKQSTEPLKLWEKIEIVVGEGPSAGHYAARIEDFQEHGVVVTPPELVSGNTLLSSGCICLVMLTRDDAVYKFSTRIRTVETLNHRLYVLDPPQNVRRVQRRQYVRIDLWEKTRFAIVEKYAENKEGESDLQWDDGIIIDFSAGGVLLRSSDEIAVGAILTLSLDFLSEPNLPQIIAAVCRRSFTRDGLAMAGIEFLRRDLLDRVCNSAQLKRLPEAVRSFDKVAQNRLVTYVFKREVELRGKGLL